MSKHNEAFGIGQLQKYGWTDGKGLGAKEDGISEALRPNLKFDKNGLGHDVAKDLAFNWWDNVFNKALDTVGKSDKEVAMMQEKEKKNKKSYSNFVLKKGNVDDEDVEHDSNIDTLSGEMVDVCEGRTAHKGARHGIYSSGKLERVKKAETDFLNQWSEPKQDTPQFGKSRTKKRQKKSKQRTEKQHPKK